MTHRFIKRISVLACVACLIVTMTGCTGDKVSLYTPMSYQKVQDWPSTNQLLEQKPEMLGVGNMKVVAEQNGTKLYFHEKTGEFAVELPDGNIWFSNPQNRLDLSAEQLNNYSSQIIVNVIDAGESFKPYTSFAESVGKGQFKVENITNGIRVEYLFGQIIRKPIYPQALSVKRFEELTKGLSKEELSTMTRVYADIDSDKLSDPITKKSLEEKFTALPELKKIRAITNGISQLQKDRIIAVFEKINYTEEDRENDQLEVGYVDPEKSSGNFTIPVSYTLEDGRFVAKVDTKAIEVIGNIKLESIMLFPYWSTANGMDTTKALFPDGSGAVVDISKVMASKTPVYKESFYGEDAALSTQTKSSTKHSLSMPMYGLYNPDGAMYATMLEGDATTSLSANPRTAESMVGSVSFESKLLNYTTVKLLPTDKSDVKSYADFSIHDPITASYTFIQKKNPSWTDIAQSYRNDLLKLGVITDGKTNKLPIAVNMLGAVDDTAHFVGIPYTVIKPLTTYTQALEMAKKMQSDLPGVSPVVRYSGWTKGGLRSKPFNKVRFESKLGGSKDFQAMLTGFKDSNIEFYPDADFQYVYNDKAFDGFSTSSDTARKIIREAAGKPTYNISNFFVDKKAPFGFLLKNSRTLSYADSFLTGLKEEGVDTTSLSYVGSDLSSDFSSTEFASRNATKDTITKLLSGTKEKGIKSITQGANQYVISSMEHLLNLSMSANQHPMFANSVPFTQMILSGAVSYTAPPLADSVDDVRYVLNCIETGSAVYFQSIAADNSVLKTSSFNSLYAVNYDSIRSRVIEASNTVSKALAPVYGQKMVDYANVQNGVVKVTYEKGDTIFVNYTNEEVTIDGAKVPANGYLNSKSNEKGE
ncbi:MAG: DUF5696 domain-containing protein [Oscillospiraceae bacterium]